MKNKFLASAGYAKVFPVVTLVGLATVFHFLPSFYKKQEEDQPQTLSDALKQVKK
jgi:hypothetical protein